jgi:peptidoglycan hydrolase CwlO-like protein
MPTVELGDLTFNPTTGADYRLSIEGTSGVGKSNTLRVILEDLADVNIPTLIVERLGAITPVRTEDENIVVVGGRDEAGIDLTVPLESLELIGDLVLDRGMKVLLDVSTYADYEDERSRVHLAAAKAVRALNDRAHEKYRAGDRTPALLVIDEAHWLAPKNSAPNPDIDEWVKRARGQIIKASTEGGNKGISVIVAYQRRAFLHNGVIQLVRDWVAHRPGDEDIDRTADALRCDPDLLAGLETGEIACRGPGLTDGELVGPTTVRRCRSPDPREDTFELPETPPEVTEAIETIQEEVEAEQAARQERQDQVERLQARVEDLRDERDTLQEELADQERLTRALESLQSGGNGGPDAEVATQLEDLRDERDQLQADIKQVSAERDQARGEVDRLTDRVEQLEAEVAELKELREFRERLLTFADAALEQFGGEAPRTDQGQAEVISRLREEKADLKDALEHAREDEAQSVKELREETERLREELEAAQAAAGDVDVPTDYEDFLADPVVQTQIEAAKQGEQTSPRYVKGVLATVLETQGPVTRQEVGERLGISNLSHVSSATGELVSRKVLMEADTSGRAKAWDLNVDGIRAIKEAQAKRDRTAEVMEQL